jgi:hypothetical protein
VAPREDPLPCQTHFPQGKVARLQKERRTLRSKAGLQNF